MITKNTRPAALAWFKSSYSGEEGGACLEVAYDWHKSSYSGEEGGNCVEVATCPDAQVHVRDSKNPTGPTLTLSPTTWAAFTAYAAERR
ncbi:DUF397 domain-containing protein [Streptomyces spirodelae]|uniref:DUF397 domain-containing protein n=1 Tax=Streptomyces spirodelae TaxID=2812904 RepID=A0ABS3WNQ2_9ACTN|nr:DUF397 domain-containing protein [Streptomyces spirodelae]MBO8184754.1 DUF397 domain-containing protein [Streptomyces spirodelae]